MKFWESIVGYVKREIFVNDGFIYLVELKNDGYFVHARWEVERIFKIFLDHEDSKIRLVFKGDHKNLITKDFQVSSVGPIFERITE